MQEAVEALIAEHAQLEAQLADAKVHTDQALARKLARRYSELTPVVAATHRWRTSLADFAAATEFAAEDPSFALELPTMLLERDAAADALRQLLIPKDPDDDRDVILEVKAGEGGEESALFAGDLFRMYLRYAERSGWKTQVLSFTDSDLGGYKDASVAIKMRGSAEPGQGVWSRLKYEGGVHRVQRVPITESQGRIHTSAAGVLVMPEPDETVELEISPSDLKIDVFRSSGPGGQSVNTTDSAVRMTHIPTGLVVSCQNEKSQLQNREQALRILRARLHALAKEQAQAEASAARRSQVRTVDRSERIRTYNFAENRISDHRTGFKAYNLDAVLDGDLEPVVQSAIAADQKAQLDGIGDE